MMHQEAEKSLQKPRAKVMNKPIRRKRVKDSLYQLKQMLLNCDPELLTKRRNGPRGGHLEEVDLLEMAIDHWQQLKAKLDTANSSDTSCNVEN